VVTDDTIPFSPAINGHLTPSLVENLWECTCPPRRGERAGLIPNPAGRPRADLLVCPVIKHRTGGRITAVSTAVIFGDPAAVAGAADPLARQPNDQYQFRRAGQPHAAATEPPVGPSYLTAFSKDLSWFEKQLCYRWPTTIWCYS